MANLPTFKQFIAEAERGSRLTSIDVDSAIHWMNEYASGYLEGGTYLLRGAHSTPRGLSQGDSSIGSPRKSANTANLYTLWFDNHPSFKKWPRRGNSFICTTKKYTAESYGVVSIVIPADRAKIGIVGRNDLWQLAVDKAAHVFINDLNEWTADTCNWFGYDIGSYAELKSALTRITQDAWIDQLKKVPTDSPYGGLIKLMEKHGANSLFELWEDLVTPSLFQANTTGDQLDNDEGEMWIEGECLFIPVEQHLVSARDQLEINEWVGDYPKFRAFLKSFWQDDFVSSDDDEAEEKIDPDSVSHHDTLTAQRKRRV